MSVSTPPDPATASSRGVAVLWSGLLGIAACAVIAASVLVFSQSVNGALRGATELQLRAQQLSADSLALKEGASAVLLERLRNQQALTDAAVADFDLAHGDRLDVDTLAALEQTWQVGTQMLTGQVARAAQTLDSSSQRRELARQLDEARAIGLSLARAVVAEAVVEPSERVAWLQWPVTLAELRLQVNRSRGDLAADMSAPVASALSETRALLATNSSVISQPVRSSLEAVLALLDSAAGRFASAGVDISVEADAAVDDSALFEFVHTLETVTAVLQSELERWRMLGALAAVIGVLALVLLGVAAWLRRSDADESGVVLEAGSAQRQHVAVVRRMADDSKRDYGIARALVQAGGKRLELLRALSANADELSGNAARLAKPRELVLRLGRQHAASQRTLVNQMATTTARLSETRKLATQWAERSDETQRLIQSLRELGERAALLQVNARIRVSSADAGLAEDFQRLNDSVLGVMAQTETLARRQSDASRRTLDGLRRSVEAQSAVEATASTAASQLRAYVNGQQDLSGRYDKLDSLLTAHARALDGLQKRAKSDQALEQRALKANRAAAKFASQAGQGDQPVTPASRTVPAARSAPQRPRRLQSDPAEVDG